MHTYNMRKGYRTPYSCVNSILRQNGFPCSTIIIVTRYGTSTTRLLLVDFNSVSQHIRVRIKK
jgi:hypothetical protein